MNEDIQTRTGDPYSIKSESKLMQNYRFALPLNPGSDMVAIADGEDDVELFTIGSDGTIWDVYPDSLSDTGYSSTTTGLNGKFVAGGYDNQGDLVIFTGNGSNLQYVYQNVQGDVRWSNPINIAMPDLCTIESVYAKRIDGQLYVAVITSTSGYFVQNFDTKTGTSNFTDISCGVRMPCVLVGTTANDASLIWMNGGGNTLNVYNFSGNGGGLIPDMFNLPHSMAVTSTGTLLSIGADNFLYFLTHPYGLSPWTRIGTQGNLKKVCMAGNDQVFCLSYDNIIYLWQPGKSDFEPICKGIADMCAASDNQNNIELFLVGTDQNAVLHMFKELNPEDTGDWVTEEVEIQTGGKMEEYPSYSSDVYFYDQAGATLSNEQVIILADSETRVTVNGKTYLLYPGWSLPVTTNALGMISVAQETDSLGITKLSFVLARVYPEGRFWIEQSTDVKNRLTGVTADDVWNATDTSGNYLLSGDYRTKDNAASIAQGCNNCMGLFSHLKEGAWSMAQGGSPAKMPPPVSSRKNWMMSFEGSQVIYQELTEEGAKALIADTNSHYPSAKGIFGWLDDLGDFFEAVFEEIVEIAKIVISGVKVAITFIINGSTYVFNSVIQSLEQAFDIVEGIWASIETLFNQLFEWLGFIFDWDDILRTHRAIAYAINQMPDFISGAVTALQSFIDQNIANLQNNVSNLFAEAITSVGSQTIGGYAANLPVGVDFKPYLSNNIVLQNFINNAGNATAINGHFLTATEGPIDDFMNILEQFANNQAMNDAFARAKGYFQNLDTSPDQIFNNMLAGLLSAIEGVVQAALAGVQVVADALLLAIAKIIDTLKDLLQETWDIPFVSQFYKWLTGSDLSILDLMALVIAIPATVLYKIFEKRAPFPDDASVDAFEHSFNATSMLQASGLIPGSRKSTQVVGQLDPMLTQLFGAITSIGTFIYGILTACSDSLLEASPKALGCATFLSELAAQVFSFPWFFTSAGGVTCSTSEGRQKWLWIFMCVGLCLDFGFLVSPVQKLPENSGDYGVWAAFTFGFIQFPLGFAAGIGSGAWVMANNIIYAIPGILKFGLIKEIVVETEYVSQLICCLADELFYSASSIIGLYLAFRNSDGFEALFPQYRH